MRLSIEKPIPEKIQEAILGMIRERSLRPGDQIPTESELCEMLGVGRSSLREAVAQMISQGLLSRTQGRGTFIRQLPVRLQGGLDELMSVTDMIKAVGAVPSTSRQEIISISASTSLAEKLAIPIGEPCVRIERIRRANDIVAAYCIDIVPSKIFDAAKSRINESLFSMLAKAGQQPSYSRTSIQPAMLTQRDLPELGEGLGLFLLLDEVHYSDAGFPICYSNDYYNSNIFKFDIMRKRA
ncbi:GntR family transcriptional regulator [Burkholderia sp. TSV86]|uniref:GntR family transcriptional regulator n=1 Tax=Burkholderia sp. TSV86 TaxID=1385594 RepID=UPI00075B4014|nr:GntR family transcriptional regulator [Burkholderia sp. TSV86]KVE34311.1 GntR family transcriptional regulator [Burkholderia sp. TSV86]